MNFAFGRCLRNNAAFTLSSSYLRRFAVDAQRPNLLFIITDHQAYAYHHRPGEFTFDEPHRAAFAAQGAEFARAYACCPVSYTHLTLPTN